MYRLLMVPLAALAIVSAIPAGDLPIAPVPRAVAPRAVAPFPHSPGEPGLSLEDIGIDPVVPNVDIERLPDVTVPKPANPNDPIGLPDVKVPTGLPGRLTLPALEDPMSPRSNPGDPDKLLPSAFPGRTGATKAKLIKEGGGNADSERAVALGLAWLARQQKEDGSWEYDQGSYKEKKAAATGMALLPFLTAGETHKNEKGRYKDTVKKGLDWLVKNCEAKGANAGKISADMYEQAIATLALCEAYGMTKDPALKPVAQTALNYIQKSQGPNGSWGYSSGTNGDTSIVGWQIQALVAAKLSKDLIVDDRVIKKAVKFLDLAAAGARKSMYGYADSAGAAPGTSLTAVGLLCRYYIDAWGPSHPGLIDGVAGLVKNPPADKGGLKNLYYYYYATQVVHFYEGEDWKNWNEGPKDKDGTRKGGMRDWLVKTQVRKDGADLGSWDPEAGYFGGSCGRVGTTAVCLLTLEVYYRHLPLYKRGADGNAVKILDDK